MKDSKSMILLFIVFLSLIVRIPFQDPWYSTVDSYSYYSNAQYLLEGDFYHMFLWVWFIGYPLLIVYSFLLLGVSLSSAVLVSTFLGILTVIAVYLLGWELAGEDVGLLSALMVALSPTHAHLSVTVMSDVPALFFLVLAALFYIKFLRSEGSRFLYLSSFFFGWSVLVKYSNGILILLPLLHSLSARSFSMNSLNRRRIMQYSTAFFFLCLALTPQILYNLVKEGNPLEFKIFETPSGIEKGFALSNAFTTGYLRGIPPIIHYPYLLFMKYTILPPFLLFFYLIGILSLIKEKKTVELNLILLWIILPFSLILFLSPHDASGRMALVTLPPLALLASSGIHYTVKTLFKKRYDKVLLLFGILYLSMIIPSYWLISDNVHVHSTEESFQIWLRENTPKDSLIISSPHHIDDHIKPVMQREAVDIRLALAEGLDHPDPAIAQDLIERGDVRSQSEKMQELLASHPNTYVLVSQYGNEEVENFAFLEDEASLTLLREECLRLSMMSPWRAYTISLFRLEGN